MVLVVPPAILLEAEIGVEPKNVNMIHNAIVTIIQLLKDKLESLGQVFLKLRDKFIEVHRKRGDKIDNNDCEDMTRREKC